MAACKRTEWAVDWPSMTHYAEGTHVTLGMKIDLQYKRRKFWYNT